MRSEEDSRMTEHENLEFRHDKLHKGRDCRVIERQAKDNFARSFKPKKKR